MTYDPIIETYFNRTLSLQETLLLNCVYMYAVYIIKNKIDSYYSDDELWVVMNACALCISSYETMFTKYSKL